MKRVLSLLTLTALLLVSVSAFGGHEKCNESTEACLKAMSAKLQKKGWLGVETDKTDSGHYRVTKVIEGSPAAYAGFQQGDVLVALNGIELTRDNKAKLTEAKKGMGPGTNAKYTVKRAGAKQQLAVTFGTVPFAVMAEWVGHHMLEQHAGVQLAQN